MAPVIQKVDNAIHWIIHPDTLYPLGSDLSGGKSSFSGAERYQPSFEQLGPSEKGSVISPIFK